MASSSFTISAIRSLSDVALLDAQRAVARRRREVDAEAAMIAAEIARRSSSDLGYDGLAQRLGARTPEKLVQQLTGSSARDAGTLVLVGSLPPESPLATAVAAGGIGVDAAAAISTGLGDSAADEVVQSLIAAAGELGVERLAARAREVRARLDEAGVVDRERLLRERRFLRFSPTGDGMTRLSGLLDPESAAVVVAA